jgi:8-oxo-dGDP phosphatase
MTEQTSWKTLGTSVAHENPWFSVRRDEVLRPDGNEGVYFVIERKTPSVFVVALTTDRKVALVKVARYTTQSVRWEVPAGGIDKGETPLKAAMRELHQETGYASDTWREIPHFADAVNGMSSAQCIAFLAEDIYVTGKPNIREEGIQEVDVFSLADVMQLIKNGDMTDALSMAAIMKVMIDQDVINADHIAWADKASE